MRTDTWKGTLSLIDVRECDSVDRVELCAVIKWILKQKGENDGDDSQAWKFPHVQRRYVFLDTCPPAKAWKTDDIQRLHRCGRPFEKSSAISLTELSLAGRVISILVRTVVQEK